MTPRPARVHDLPRLRTLVSGLVALLLAACQSGWVTLEGRRAEADALRAAESACRVDQRLAALDAAEADRARRLRESTGNAETMVARADFDARASEIRAALDSCMRDQGFRPG